MDEGGRSTIIQAILADDEPLAIQYLEKLLTDSEMVQVIGKYSDGPAVLHALQTMSPDVAFLDIGMMEMDGLELARLLNDRQPPISIVFVTAYREFAVQAFELESVDYLLKPVSPVRLEKTLQRVQRILDDQKAVDSIPGSPPSPTLRIQCFPALQVFYKEELVKWKTAKVKELFALLLSYHHQALPRDVIIEQLWPEVPAEKATTQLHTAMSYLRKTLSSWDAGNSISFSQGNYTLKLASGTCDLFELEQLTEKFPEFEEAAVPEYERVLEDCQGEYLELNGYSWAMPIAADCRETVITLLLQLIDYYEAHSLYGKQQKYLQKLLQLDPYSEPSAERLMYSYIASGNRAEAMKVYQSLKDRLSDQLGISPSHTITELFTSLAVEVAPQ